MELEDLEEFEAKGSKLTWPGEYLTSSQAFMRCGPATIIAKDYI